MTPIIIIIYVTGILLLWHGLLVCFVSQETRWETRRWPR